MLERKMASVENSIECSICFENIPKEKIYFTECIHSFCTDCFQKWKESCDGDVTCPNCRLVLEKRQKEVEIQMLINPIVRVLNYTGFEEDDEEYPNEDEEEGELDYPDEDSEEDEDYHRPKSARAYVNHCLHMSLEDCRRDYQTEDEYQQDLRDYREFMASFNRS